MVNVVGEKGLKRHLDETIRLQKRGIEYEGTLGIDGEGKYFVGVDFISEEFKLNSIVCKNENARVYINRPGKDVVWFLGRSYRVGNGRRATHFRDFEFASYNPASYRAVQKELMKETRFIIGNKGLNRNVLDFCGVKKLLPNGTYSYPISGLLFSRTDKDFKIIWAGNGDRLDGHVDINDWDEIVLSERTSGRDNRLRTYIYRKK